MADQTIPPWLATMRAISGTHEVEGGGDSPVILAWRNEIARCYPDMAAYCATYTHDSIPWCGLTVAYCMAHNGIKPVKEFLWADNWRKFGTKLDKPRLGCILTFKRTGGNHVALYEGEVVGGYYLIRGGNQSDAVGLMRKAKSECTGMVWPAVATVVAPVKPAPVVVSKPPVPAKPPVKEAAKQGVLAAVIAALAALLTWLADHPVFAIVATAALVAACWFGWHWWQGRQKTESTVNVEELVIAETVGLVAVEQALAEKPSKPRRARKAKSTKRKARA